MKHAKLTIMLALVFLLIVGMQTQLTTPNPQSLVVEDNLMIEDQHAIAAINIEVTSNGGFTTAGFSGAGTYADPYILNGAIVDVTSGNGGIAISGTSAHFIIRNCTITGTGATGGSTDGISIASLSNGTIENCEITGFDTGIVITITEDFIVTKNKIEDTTFGIEFDYSPMLLIDNNTILNSRYYGIYEAGFSRSSTIQYNRINRMNYYSDLAISYGIQGISDYLNITDNDVRSGDGLGIFLSGSD
ncbi:MAG: right-handed parallel beta-helix repeat-containing protein, partial [Candidatus Thorarchaeota archaeon]|nr:right-handed parallel beta-helix repeat-containing protein [Candidatus Thorarchaeota archaeon]